jgi:hypothetical protein
MTQEEIIEEIIFVNTRLQKIMKWEEDMEEPPKDARMFKITKEYLDALNGEGIINMSLGLGRSDPAGEILPFEAARKYLQKYKNYKIKAIQRDAILRQGLLPESGSGIPEKEGLVLQQQRKGKSNEHN